MLKRVSAALVTALVCVSCGEENNARPAPTAGAGGDQAQCGTQVGNSGSAGAAVSAGTGGADGASGGGSLGAGAGGGSDLPQTCQELAAVVCAELTACAPYYAQITLGDAGDCIARVESGCAHFDQVGTPLDVLACVRELHLPDCSGIAAIRDVPLQCYAPPGPQMVGGPCTFPFDCDSLLCFKGNQACGQCAQRVGEGATCDDLHVCNYDLACVEGSCQRAASRNAECGDMMPCLAGSSCVEGSCQVWGQEGESCDALHPCDGLHGFSCSQSTCVKLGVAELDGACGVSALANCRAGTSCGADSLCVAEAPLDGACGMGNGCDFPLRCADFVCGYKSASACPM